MKSSSQGAGSAPSRDRVLVIMAKAPRPGAVKTRLTSSLPVHAVTELYRCLLEDTVALAKSLTAVEVAVLCPASDVDELARVLGSTVKIVAQKGEGLAAGLTSVFAYFTRGHRAVIAFNSDSPHLPPSVLDRAFETLAVHDVVIGPTHDGGYYLVGARAAHPTLFENDGMGTANALEALMARARALHLSTGLTDPFYDIDVAEDLIRLSEELRQAPAKAPKTAVWFGEWRQALARLRTGTGEP
jgi:uncharacterized protein